MAQSRSPTCKPDRLKMARAKRELEKASRKLDKMGRQMDQAAEKLERKTGGTVRIHRKPPTPDSDLNLNATMRTRGPAQLVTNALELGNAGLNMACRQPTRAWKKPAAASKKPCATPASAPKPAAPPARP